GGRGRLARRHRAPRPRVRELRHVRGLRGAWRGLPRRRGAPAVIAAPRSPAAPLFRGPLAGQRPRIRGALGGDPWLVLAVAALVGLSVVMVFNVSYFYGQDHFGDSLLFFRKHLLAVGLGTVVAVVASRLSSDTYRRAAYPLLIVVLVTLVLVLVPGIGLARGGARRWLHLGPLSVQPSELAKFALVLYLARSLV